MGGDENVVPGEASGDLGQSKVSAPAFGRDGGAAHTTAPRSGNRKPDAGRVVGGRYAHCPPLFTAIHRKKKKQKERGTADDGPFLFSTERTRTIWGSSLDWNMLRPARECKNFFKVSGLRFLEMSAFGVALWDGQYRNNRAQCA